jgi:hypothetical protein
MRDEFGKGLAAYRAREWDAPERQFRRCLELSPGPALTAAHFRSWPIASFRCAAEFGRYRGIADSDKPSTRQIYGFTA